MKTGRWVTGALVLGALGAGAMLTAFYRPGGDSHADASGSSPAIPQRTIPVAVTPATVRTIEERLTVQGTIEAKHSALVPARIGGTLEEIFVDEGDAVVAGETALFQTDALKLRKAVEVSKQDLAVARCALAERKAYQESIQADFEKAEKDVVRFERLYKDKAVPLDALEQQQTRFRAASANCKHAQSLADLAAEQLRQAGAALAIAEKDLADTLVVAPIGGKVSARFYEPGEMGEAGKPVLRIDDLSVVEVSGFLPAQYYDRVIAGTTYLRLQVYGKEVGEPVISYKSPTIDPTLRTFEIKARIQDPPEGVVPGSMADIAIVLERRESLAVPSQAVVVRDGRKAVFVVEGKKARIVYIEAGLEADGWIRLPGESAVASGDLVVTMGQFLLDDGTPVTVQEGGGAQGPENA